MNLTYYLRGHLVNTYVSLLDMMPNAILQQNKIFKNIHRGQRLFILGSGNSIKLQDMKLLDGEIVMTQNHFHAHQDIAIINPTYHVNVPKFHPKEYDKDWEIWFDTMEERLPAHCTFFWGLNTKEMIDRRPTLNKRSYYIDPQYNPNCLSKAHADITKIIMRVPTVLTQCLSIAIYMGFKEIYLVGMDLNQSCIIQENRDEVRFYGNSPITSNQAEKNAEIHLMDTGIEWFNQWAIWKQLNLLNVAAKENQVQILNATRGGLLNMFPRVNYENLLKK